MGNGCKIWTHISSTQSTIITFVGGLPERAARGRAGRVHGHHSGPEGRRGVSEPGRAAAGGARALHRAVHHGGRPGRGPLGHERGLGRRPGGRPLRRLRRQRALPGRPAAHPRDADRGPPQSRQPHEDAGHVGHQGAAQAEEQHHRRAC